MAPEYVHERTQPRDDYDRPITEPPAGSETPNRAESQLREEGAGLGGLGVLPQIALPLLRRLADATAELRARAVAAHAAEAAAGDLAAVESEEARRTAHGVEADNANERAKEIRPQVERVEGDVQAAARVDEDARGDYQCRPPWEKILEIRLGVLLGLLTIPRVFEAFALKAQIWDATAATGVEAWGLAASAALALAVVDFCGGLLSTAIWRLLPSHRRRLKFAIASAAALLAAYLAFVMLVLTFRAVADAIANGQTELTAAPLLWTAGLMLVGGLAGVALSAIWALGEDGRAAIRWTTHRLKIVTEKYVSLRSWLDQALAQRAASKVRAAQAAVAAAEARARLLAQAAAASERQEAEREAADRLYAIAAAAYWRAHFERLERLAVRRGRFEIVRQLTGQRPPRPLLAIAVALLVGIGLVALDVAWVAVVALAAAAGVLAFALAPVERVERTRARGDYSVPEPGRQGFTTWPASGPGATHPQSRNGYRPHRPLLLTAASPEDDQ